ncbi:MAG: hypothetical protein ABH827_01990 [bacterium]
MVLSKKKLFIICFFAVISCWVCLESSESVSDQDQGKQLTALLGDPKYQEYMKTKQGIVAPNFDFYTQYIKKYYPKVFVIRELFFEHMTPDQIALALDDIINVFTDQPWFYFVDKSNQISVPSYWEYILDQLSFISEFLCIARVDLITKKISVPEQSKSSFYSNYMSYLYDDKKKTKNTQDLFVYFQNNGKTVVYDFYALSFDFVIKIFNEAILLKDLKCAKRCFTDLEYILKKLAGSLYEQDYQDVLKTCKELLASLKTKCGVDDVAQLEELFGDDAEGKQIAKESAELGVM